MYALKDKSGKYILYRNYRNENNKPRKQRVILLGRKPTLNGCIEECEEAMDLERERLDAIESGKKVTKDALIQMGVVDPQTGSFKKTPFDDSPAKAKAKTLEFFEKAESRSRRRLDRISARLDKARALKKEFPITFRKEF